MEYEIHSKAISMEKAVSHNLKVGDRASYRGTAGIIIDMNNSVANVEFEEAIAVWESDPIKCKRWHVMVEALDFVSKRVWKKL